MNRKYQLLIGCLCILQLVHAQLKVPELFPDGSEISDWFRDTTKVKVADLGQPNNIMEYGAVADRTVLQTKAIQRIIDVASENGGWVIAVPKGTFLSGSLFFKPNTHLFLAEGSVLKGSDDITDYPKIPSRMEGQNLDYFAALINAYNVNGFTISGQGTIDGNGLKFWKAFWQRRAEDPNYTNLEVSRPRLVFIWNSNDIQVQDVRSINSGFWSSHYYQCKNVRILDLHIFSPHEPIKAPSADAIDLDVCSNVLIKGCYMAVNDDAIALKGGKGPWADKDSNNGENTNIIIEDCTFGFCHSALTLGSESIHNRNILMRNCTVNEAKRLLWLKMRPDTPQKYEFVIVENITGQAHSIIYVKPWTQFFDLKGRPGFPLLPTKQVFKNENDTVGELYLACSDLNLSYGQITTIYKKRWGVEEYHKSIRSNTGFAKSPTKTIKTQTNHYVLSILAYIKLEWLKQRTGKNHFAMKAQIYLAAQQAAYTELKKLSTPRAA